MCTNIVTNSYSCGIGEQNRNALMMGKCALTLQ